MTSLSLFPRPLALSAYSAVSGSRMTLCLAISCSALFACRSPPLLSLCLDLTVLPLEAGMGAGAAYRRERRLGAQPARVVPGRDRELGRAHGPAPVHRQQRGAVLLQGRLDRALHVERRVARRRPQVRQRVTHNFFRKLTTA